MSYIDIIAFVYDVAEFYGEPDHSDAELQSVGTVVASKPSVTMPILRKDFPETWIWDDVNEER